MFQSQNLSLQQVLAPQLQQSLLILQAPLLELRNLVQQEMETNPVLEELAEPTEEERQVSESEPAEDNFKEEFDQLAKLDDEWRDYMAQSSSYSGRSKEEDEKRQFFFDSIATQETLQQHLVGQLNQTALSGDDRKTAELIIGNIDDNGFLQTTPEEMAMNTGIRAGRFRAHAHAHSELLSAGRRRARFARVPFDSTETRGDAKRASNTGSSPTT